MISIATVRRHWIRYDWYGKRPDDRSIVCMAMAELLYDTDRCQFRVKYREWTDMTREQWIPEQYTKAWMNHFSRDQSTLQPDSYYIYCVRDGWEEFLEKLV